MSETHPHRVVNALLPDRAGEIAELRDNLAAVKVEAERLAHRVIEAEEDAERYRLLYRSLLQSYGEAVRERDAARDHAQAVGEQQPVWETGPRGAA